MNTDDPRLGQLVERLEDDRDIFQRAESCLGTQLAIVGVPEDEGVRRNGGRVGARKGPAAFRERYVKIGTLVNMERKQFDGTQGLDIRNLSVKDLGDVPVDGTLEDTHEAISKVVATLVQNGVIPFVVGGGNDQSAAVWRGLVRGLGGDRYARIGVVNLDAHLDVRPLKEGKTHSGSPFREIVLEAEAASSPVVLVEFASQGSQCAEEHVKFVREHGGTIVWLSELRSDRANRSVSRQFEDLIIGDKFGPNMPLFISFDVDCIRSADCPGVSAPASVGLTAEEALDICFLAGSHPRVHVMDVSEYNPLIEDHRTGRLISFMMYNFLQGLSIRKQRFKI